MLRIVVGAGSLLGGLAVALAAVDRRVKRCRAAMRQFAFFNITTAAVHVPADPENGSLLRLQDPPASGDQPPRGASSPVRRQHVEHCCADSRGTRGAHRVDAAFRFRLAVSSG
jgi:hypothetical protein